MYGWYDECPDDYRRNKYDWYDEDDDRGDDWDEEGLVELWPRSNLNTTEKTRY